MDADTRDLASLRGDYQLAGLDESDLVADPVEMFTGWFDAARGAGALAPHGMVLPPGSRGGAPAGAVLEPNARVLATVSADGLPAARTVLLKGLSAEGFVFYTNYESRKAAELWANPHCSLLFGWYDLQRPV